MKKINFSKSDLSSRRRLSDEFLTPPMISPETIREIQRSDDFPDTEFDKIYPPKMKAMSDIQWSSLKVAKKIADMVGPNTKARFMDIGSGVGKLCTLLHFLTDLEIFGIEQRKALFKISQVVAKTNNLNRLHFIHGNMLDLNWEDYDIFYFYNPFQEHLYSDTDLALIDKNIDLDRKYYVQYLDEVFRQMTWLAPGKKVITFHGYGGRMPPSMRIVHSHPVHNGELCMWEKKSDEKT